MNNEKTNHMKISDWLDEKEAENVDVSQIALPDDLSYDEVPDSCFKFRMFKSKLNESALCLTARGLS